MIKIDTKEDPRQVVEHHKLVICPTCGQKLTDVKYVDGIVMLRIKCRRCRKYISVDLIGSKEDIQDTLRVEQSGSSLGSYPKGRWFKSNSRYNQTEVRLLYRRG